jgi:outer membrane protein assembly factor BamE (lipoprotein component of BamABCDE complex)
MWKNLLLIILAVMSLASCTTPGGKYDPTVGSIYDTTAVDRIVVGQTTDREVLARMGEPFSERKLSNDMKFYNYTYGKGCLTGFGSSVNSLELQFYKGVVINKRQTLAGE